MSTIRLDSKEDLRGAWAAGGGKRNVPERSDKSETTPKSPPIAGARAASGGFWRHTMQVARYAVTGLLLLVSVPLGIVHTRGDGVVGLRRLNLEERIEDLDRRRPLMAPKDASITPQQAGAAFHALQLQSDRVDLPMQPVSTVHSRPWADWKLAPGTFPMMLSGFNGPAHTRVLEDAVNGFTPEQLELLRQIAEASLWKDYDIVARAPAVDIIGGQFILPFRDDAFAGGVSLRHFRDTKELALAGVSRAAYYLAIGERDRAEMALRSIVSFGFALIDNATTAMDALIGRSIVDIGRFGLHDFHRVLRLPPMHGEEFDHQVSAPRTYKPADEAIVSSEFRRLLIQDVGNADLSQGMRYESLRSLSFSTCGNVKEMLLGPDAEVKSAYDRASETLARFESERAYINLIYEAPNRIPEWRPRKLGDRLAMGAATVAGTVLNNPRVTTCTRMVLAYQ